MRAQLAQHFSLSEIHRVLAGICKDLRKQRHCSFEWKPPSLCGAVEGELKRDITCRTSLTLVLEFLVIPTDDAYADCNVIY